MQTSEFNEALLLPCAHVRSIRLVEEVEEEEAPGSAAVQSSAGRYCYEPGKV